MILYSLFTVTIFCCLVEEINGADPVINNLPDATDLHEDTSTENLLIDIDATDADLDSITCAIGPGTNPGQGSTDFRIKQASGTGVWGIYTVAGIDYDYGNPYAYNLQVKCDDGTNTATSTFTVNLQPNEAPGITNLPVNTTLSTSESIGFNVFLVEYSDPESDQVTLSITCDPVGCPFDIFDAGNLQLNAELAGTTITGYDVTVTPTDINGNVGTAAVLSVIIADINDVPEIQNLGTTLAVTENSPFADTLETTTCTDQDTADTLTYSMLCSPTSGSTYFLIDSSSGIISTSNSLINYETISAGGGTTTFTCTVTCSDGEATDTAVLTLEVTDVNEAPAFPQNAYSISVDEGAGGTALQTSGYGIIDDDVGDTDTFTFDCGTSTGYFSIDAGTGILSFSTEYDVDDGSRPTSVSCTVTVTDSGGLTDTVSLDITVSNINDNSPIFLVTPYTWFASSGASVGTELGTVTATDADNGTYGVITYSLDQSGLTDEYFAVTQSGNIYIQNDISPIASGSNINFNVIASDGGGTQAQSTITVVITPTTTTTTTTTTDRYRTFFEDGRNIAWFVASCVLLLVCGIVIVWMCYTFTQDGCISAPRWRRKPQVRAKQNWGEEHRRNMKEPDPPQPKPPADGFNFWSTEYAKFV